ncbi:hypothetical protein IFM89_031282 [Coptis chinensis]|uniref:Pentatricopeptide repeat-containing protein n=1 Tax=Coptis chinensis TaxID=261450 RepID=A0A835MB73_9MAGN|nr:hypothetical protein IFM89_031282 [Coptis chinensis]
MDYAFRLFEEISEPNVISWNVMISGYNRSSQYDDTWRVFCKMRVLGFDPNQYTYGSVLSACAALRGIWYGNLIYCLVIKNGFYSNGYVRTGMIHLFMKSFCFEEGLRLFSDVLCENVVCWNAIISGAVINRENFVALEVFSQMLCGNLMPNNHTYPSVLSACTALGELELGKQVHGWVLKCGLQGDVFVGTSIVDMYAKVGDINDAVKGFSLMVIHNVVSWTAIIAAFLQREDPVSALQFFKEMRKVGVEVNNYTLTSVLTACAKPQMMKEAIQIHSLILKCGFDSDSTVINSLINMYSKMGDVFSSEVVFRESGTATDVESWAVMISGFAQNQSSGRAFETFRRMILEGIRPDKFCSSSVLSIIECINLGRQIHCYILKVGLVSDVSAGSALFTMYSKYGSLEEAYEVFEQIHGKDKVSWTSMIAGFAEHGCADQAFHLFQEMVSEGMKPDRTTLSAILMACSAVQSLQKGKEVHAYALNVGIGSDSLVGGGLVAMYSKCGALVSARKVFELMPRKDQVSWSSLVSGYAQNGYVEDSILLYHEMLVAGMDVDSFTVSSLLGIAATLTKADLGKKLHTPVVKIGLSSDLSVGSSLITMYSKCGSIEDSYKVFDQIENPDLFTWTSMIIGYAQHGKGMEALRLFDLMRKKEVEPDSVTFVGVLSACSHSGLVEEGYSHLNSMTKYHGIKPGSRHYACMVDILGRSGRLEEAANFIAHMPIEPDALVWGALLASCKVHGDVELGRLAAKRVFELESTGAGAYISLSNILADVGQWDEVINIRSLMKGVGVQKEPGWSLCKS